MVKVLIFNHVYWFCWIFTDRTYSWPIGYHDNKERSISNLWHSKYSWYLFEKSDQVSRWWLCRFEVLGRWNGFTWKTPPPPSVYRVKFWHYSRSVDAILQIRWHRSCTVALRFSPLLVIFLVSKDPGKIKSINFFVYQMHWTVLKVYMKRNFRQQFYCPPWKCVKRQSKRRLLFVNNLSRSKVMTVWSSQDQMKRWQEIEQKSMRID